MAPERIDYDAAVDRIARALPEVTAVYLFGSRAKGAAGPDSDVDLAVLMPTPLDPLVRWELQETLAALLHADVDLVDLRSAPAVLKVQVLDGARLLLDRAPATRESFEATALAMYARLNEERRGILDDIRARGHVHG